MFDRHAAAYDSRNSFFSLGLDRSWRRKAAAAARLKPGDLALDLCTGTGKLARALLPYVRPTGRVVGIDFSKPMLERARRLEPQVEFLLGDVVALPFADASADAITIGFGYRNLVDRRAGLKEFHRVLRPGGRLVILELPPPPPGPLGALYRFYLVRVMPRVADWLSRGEEHAYHYLSATVQDFPSPAALVRDLEQAGFREVKVRLLSLGIAAIHVGVKP
jgi:demethylmenaquinone methyltransferase/2-methoxy-6-polyprenyl-1,4-benzoquinol methylase